MDPKQFGLGVATDAASDLMQPGSDGRVASPGPIGDRVVDATEPNESVDDEQPSTYDHQLSAEKDGTKITKGADP